MLTFTGQLPDGTHYDVHYWFQLAHGYFDMQIKCCVNGGSYDVKPVTAFCEYQETTYTLMEFREGQLCETTRNNNDYSGRYDADAITKKAAALKQKEEEYEKLISSFPYLFKGVMNIRSLR